jgi:hypothetical protein
LELGIGVTKSNNTLNLTPEVREARLLKIMGAEDYGDLTSPGMRLKCLYVNSITD